MYKLNLGFFDKCVTYISDDVHVAEYPTNLMTPHSSILLGSDMWGNSHMVDIIGDSMAVPMFEVFVSIKGSIENENVRNNILADISMKIVHVIYTILERRNLPVDLNDILIPIKQAELREYKDGTAYGWVNVGIAYLTSKEEILRAL